MSITFPWIMNAGGLDITRLWPEETWKKESLEFTLKGMVTFQRKETQEEGHRREGIQFYNDRWLPSETEKRQPYFLWETHLISALRTTERSYTCEVSERLKRKRIYLMTPMSEP